MQEKNDNLKTNIDALEMNYENFHAIVNQISQNGTCVYEDCKKYLTKIEYLMKILSKFTLERSNLDAMFTKMCCAQSLNWFYISKEIKNKLFETFSIHLH